MNLNNLLTLNYMQALISKINETPKTYDVIYLINDIKDIEKIELSQEENYYVRNQFIKYDKKVVGLHKLSHWEYFQIIDKHKNNSITLENCRKAGNTLGNILNENKIDLVAVIDFCRNPKDTLAFVEGMALGNYQFLKYKTETKDKQNTLLKIEIRSEDIHIKEIDELQILIDANFKARDLVNEPSSYLTAEKLSEFITELAKETDAKVEVFTKSKIEALKMGGLLAVNKGSQDPPTFTIFEWKPKNAHNEKPYIFVGKGITFDTGGISIKPSSGMEAMKCDMAGAAAVSCAVYAIAKNKLPIHVIALVPATDNKPDAAAYNPGDVIKMYNGKTVEVISTDAEGRLLLGDALSYAKQYEPEFVIDLATLTGSAHAAIGKFACVGMGHDHEFYMSKLMKSANHVCERIVEFPFWDEYNDLIKSDVADMKNVGGAHAGSITAGKFLQHYVDYPWVHLDIAGPAYMDNKENYRGKGGTGFGVRLLYDFLKNIHK